MTTTVEPLSELAPTLTERQALAIHDAAHGVVDMTPTTETTPPPFSTWITKFLLSGPGAGAQPRDEETRAEFKRIWGSQGENVPETWRTHEQWLRQAALECNIQPTFRGRFFSEAMASARRKGL